MRFLLFFCLTILYHFSYSQNIDHFVVGTDGGFAGNNQFSLSYTIGEVVTEFGVDSTNNVHLTQGFQQSYISIVSVEDHLIDIEINVYPNPAVDFLNVQISDLTDVENYSLFDMSGKLIENKPIPSKQFKIGFQQVSMGTYFIVFSNKEKKLKTLKVLKSN